MFIPRKKGKHKHFVSPIIPEVMSRDVLMTSSANHFGSRTKRPIDKSLISIAKNSVDASQVQTILITATFPCTIVGLRWSLSFTQDGGTGDAGLQWAVVVVRDGNTADTMSGADAASFYNPEQDVLAFGVGAIDNHGNVVTFDGNTKTMRKLKGGDQLIFIQLGNATDTTRSRGVVQFFCKT